MMTAIRTAALRLLLRGSLGLAALACLFFEPTDEQWAILNNAGALLRAPDGE